jgi:hypothetical protein
MIASVVVRGPEDVKNNPFAKLASKTWYFLVPGYISRFSFRMNPTKNSFHIEKCGGVDAKKDTRISDFGIRYRRLSEVDP